MLLDLKTVLLILLMMIVLYLIIYDSQCSKRSKRNKRSKCDQYDQLQLYEQFDNSNYAATTAQLQKTQNDNLQSIVSLYNGGDMTVNKISVPQTVADTIETTNTLNITTSANKNIIFNTKNNIVLNGGLCSNSNSNSDSDNCVDATNLMKALVKYTKNEYMYSSGSKDYTIYQNIVDASATDANQLSSSRPFTKSGTPTGNWNTITNWNKRNIINIGTGENAYPNGAVVLVPGGMSVVWIRTLNERWNAFKVLDSTGKEYNTYASGYRNLNTISPDGGCAPDTMASIHKWMPMVVPKSSEDKKYVIIHRSFASPNVGDGYISGLAFSTNPWNHATNSAAAYRWKANGGDQLGMDGDNGVWNNDQKMLVLPGVSTVLYVPVVYSGKDKLVYIVDHNNNWDSLLHVSVMVNDVPIERFRTTYNNPFSRHFSSKIYQRYLAALVPAALIDQASDCKCIKLTISMANQDEKMYIREVGTHDAY